MKYYILFNPLAASGSCENKLESLSINKDTNQVFYDITSNNYENLISNLENDDKIIICGGDGTINRFINATEGMKIKNDILYFAAGSGNDFAKDIGVLETCDPIKINDYIENLPLVTINNKKYRFLNGIGFGIDGYCCQEVNRLRRETGKKVHYVPIALKGLFKYYTPTNAEIMVDGKKFFYSRVWMATSMKGRYFGGGIKIAPDQDRFASDGKITFLAAHNMSRFRILTVFPSIFKGTHPKYTQYVDIHKGYEVAVKFDRPTPLQIDGETIENVTEYSVCVPLVKAFNPKPV